VLRQLKIATLANLFGFTIVIGLVVAIASSIWAISELKVGGPLYQRISQGKDLVADILPPPEYIIEAFLEVNLAKDDPAGLAEHRARLAKLHQDYNDRHAFWVGQDIDPGVRDRLTRDAHAPAVRFWEITEGRFLPALVKGDAAEADKAYAAMAEAYSAHRARIDAVVKDADRLTAATETFAKNRESTFMTVVWGVSILVLLIAVAGVAGVIFGMVRPMRDMTEAMARLAQGDLTTPIPSTGRQDEIGAMAQAVQVFKDNAAKVEALQREQEQTAARAAAERRQAMQRMGDQFEADIMGVVNEVSGSAGQMQTTAQSMSSAAQQATAQASTVAAAAEQATSNVETVAAAAEQLSASIAEISRQVAEAARISNNASEETARTNTMVQGLAAAANRIGEVVELITSIASQTNLLALNATIEAARAGEAGKGFAVVANEVKNLANQTAKATDEIGAQVGTVQEETRRAVEAIRTIGGVIEQVRQISSGIASAVEQQGAATREIARNVQEAAHGTHEVSAAISGVTQAATTTGTAAEQVLSSAGLLTRNADQLRQRVTAFVSGVRAG
jgi:methyl-accepting chemotaxis protein